MGKLKSCNCHLCNQPLQRHDEKRTVIRVAKRVRKEVHLSCHQNNVEVDNGTNQ